MPTDSRATQWTLSSNDEIPYFDDGWPKYTFFSKEAAQIFIDRRKLQDSQTKFEILPHSGYKANVSNSRS